MAYLTELDKRIIREAGEHFRATYDLMLARLEATNALLQSMPQTEAIALTVATNAAVIKAAKGE